MLGIAALIVSIIAVVVSVVSIIESRKAMLAGTYFVEKSAAYSDFLKAVSDFTFNRGLSHRDSLAAALYRLSLFAPDRIEQQAEELYGLVLHWAKTNPQGALEVDTVMSKLKSAMKADLRSSMKTGRV